MTRTKCEVFSRVVGYIRPVSQWNEGKGISYEYGKGWATFNMAKEGVKPWSYPSSDITSVICGCGNSFWRFADASKRPRTGNK